MRYGAVCSVGLLLFFYFFLIGEGIVWDNHHLIVRTCLRDHRTKTRLLSFLYFLITSCIPFCLRYVSARYLFCVVCVHVDLCCRKHRNHNFYSYLRTRSLWSLPCSLIARCDYCLFFVLFSSVAINVCSQFYYKLTICLFYLNEVNNHFNNYSYLKVRLAPIQEQ